jgi:hypothetical protein
VEAGALAPSAPRGPFGLPHHRVSQLLQDAMAGPPGALMEGGWRLAPLPHLGGGKGAVTAPDDAGLGPGVAQVLDQAWPHGEPRRPAEALGLAYRGAQASREALRPVEGEETRATILAIVTAGLLRARGRVLGVVKVQHDQLGRAVVRGAQWLHQHPRQAGECGA